MIPANLRLLYYYLLLDGTIRKDWEACKTEYWIIDRIKILDHPELVIQAILEELERDAEWR